MSTRHPQNFADDHLAVTCEHTDGSGISLPEQLSSNYQILSCLKYSEQSATYLVKQISSGKTALLKTTGDFLFAETLINEKNILDFIRQQEHPIAAGFPYNLAVIQTQDTYYYVRSYIEGKTLEELCESNLKKPGMSPSLALNYAIQLTELLQFLHTLKPPVIHRDIKPQNVVVDTNGICHFIDMGISRFFDKAKKSDTLIMGTRITAPPEQFGYHQTDIRSDLYSLGIVLYYCITGEYEIQEKHLAELEPDIQKIITKATMFDPDKRYQTTEELLPDLLTARYHFSPSRSSLQTSKGFPKKALILSLCLNLALVGGLAYQHRHFNGKLTALVSQKSTSQTVPGYQEPQGAEDSNADTYRTAYTFKEPVIEEAVREILSIPSAPITEADLEKITSLHIMGLQIFTDDSEIWFQGQYPYSYVEEYRMTDLYLQRGTISSLEDITHMPNLKTLSLYKQQIADISLLKDTSVEHLGLGYNPVTDFTPLEGNTSIRSLNLADAELTDLGIISTLPNLEVLNISSTAVNSVNGLEKTSIKELDLFEVNLNDYSELRPLPYLETLVLNYMNADILNTLSGLPLKELTVRRYQNIMLDDFSAFPKLEALAIFGHTGEELEHVQPVLPSLKELNLNQVTIQDFKKFSSLTSLQILKIYGAEVKSFEGLEQLPDLVYINCTPEQEKTFKKQYPENDYIFMY